MTDAAEPTDAGAPQTYEQARAELEDVVRRLEAGGAPLEESLALWSAGSCWRASVRTGSTVPAAGWLPWPSPRLETRRSRLKANKQMVRWRGSPDACCAPG